MNLQEIFNKVYTGLRDQGFERAVNERGNCMYRAPDGKKCAFGHLIPDELYKPEMEDVLARFLIVSNKEEFQELTKWAKVEIGPYSQEVQWLQSIHDSCHLPVAMDIKLQQFAQGKRLVVPE